MYLKPALRQEPIPDAIPSMDTDNGISGAYPANWGSGECGSHKGPRDVPENPRRSHRHTAKGHKDGRFRLRELDLRADCDRETLDGLGSDTRCSEIGLV